MRPNSTRTHCKDRDVWADCKQVGNCEKKLEDMFACRRTTLHFDLLPTMEQVPPIDRSPQPLASAGIVCATGQLVQATTWRGAQQGGRCWFCKRRMSIEAHTSGERAEVRGKILARVSPRFNRARQCPETGAQRVCLTMELGEDARMRNSPSKISLLLGAATPHLPCKTVGARRTLCERNQRGAKRWPEAS